MQQRKVVKRMTLFPFLLSICQLKEKTLSLFFVSASQMFCSLLSVTWCTQVHTWAMIHPITFTLTLLCDAGNFSPGFHSSLPPFGFSTLKISLQFIFWNLFLLSTHNNFIKLPTLLKSIFFPLNAPLLTLSQDEHSTSIIFLCFNSFIHICKHDSGGARYCEMI